MLNISAQENFKLIYFSNVLCEFLRESRQLYRSQLGVKNGKQIIVEMIFHCYPWKQKGNPDFIQIATCSEVFFLYLLRPL